MGLLKSLASLLLNGGDSSPKTSQTWRTTADTSHSNDVLVKPNPAADHLSHAYVADHDDSIIGGYKFCATMQLRTPLFVLEHHCEYFRGSSPPVYGRQADGIWIPKVKTLAEMDIDLPEMKPSTMASSVGYVPEDGGDYLPFLKEVRGAVETDDTIKNKIQALRLVLQDQKYAKFVRKHGGQNEIVDYFFPRMVDTIPGVSKPIVTALRKLNITTVRQLRKQQDKDLLSVKGLGPSALKKIREFCDHYSGDDTADRIDGVRG